MPGASRRIAPQKFGINFRKLGKLLLKFQVCGNAGASLSALLRRLQQKFPHLSGSQALDQIKERAVLESTTAAAVRLAARQVLFDVRGAHEIEGNGSPF
jgi:hypothetical protein